MSIKPARLFILFAVLILSLPIVARAEIYFSYLHGAQENPPVATSATGYARVSLDSSTGMINFTLVFNNLTTNQIASHIHTGAIGVNGPVTIDLGAVGGTSGTITGTRAITPTQINSLRANGMYVNVHTTMHGGGEIRGQLGKKRPVDFDGDGRQDYSVLKFPATGDPRPINWWNLNSTTGVQIQPGWGNALTDFPAPGDYEGDGRDDFALFRANAAGTQSEYWIILSSNSTVRYFAWGLGGDLQVARDYDGDGVTDVATFRRGPVAGAQATWYIRNSTDGTARVVGFGTTGTSTFVQDFPVPGDYDGDGKYDLAVYRAAPLTPGNTYIVLRSSDSSITYFPFGNFTSDYILPGDYDGDGKFDYAVGRTGATATAPMVWWIHQSSNGQVRVQQFGITADLPVQGDYDGDARTDISVYRLGAATGNPNFFWVLRSLDLSAQVTQWGVRGDFAVATFDSR